MLGKVISKGEKVIFDNKVYACYLHMVPRSVRRTPTTVMYCRKIGSKPAFKPVVTGKDPCSKLVNFFEIQRQRIYKDLQRDMIINADPYDDEVRLWELEDAYKRVKRLCPNCERIQSYLKARKNEIERALERDEEIGADPYPNWMRLKTIQAIMNAVNKTICRGSRSHLGELIAPGPTIKEKGRTYKCNFHKIRTPTGGEGIRLYCHEIRGDEGGNAR